jgi:hypothetical protein
MKQETLEEVAERILANNIDGLRDALKDDDLFFFYKGVIQCYGQAMAQQDKQDEFAIGFAEWCIKKRIDFFDSTEIGETYTIDGNVSKYKMNELLEIYKKESNL